MAVGLGICNFFANSIKEIHDSKARGYLIYSFFLTSLLNCSNIAKFEALIAISPSSYRLILVKSGHRSSFNPGQKG